MLFWIPVNKAMFTGDDDYAATHDLVPVARTAAVAFIQRLRIPRTVRQAIGNEAVPHPTGS